MSTKILVIEDDLQHQRMLKQMLEESGYEVITAADGDEGIAACQALDFNIVLTDIIMPNKEGIETIVELRKSYPDLKIIAMSGGGRSTPLPYLEMAKKLGAQKALQKPIRLSQLLETVNELL